MKKILLGLVAVAVIAVAGYFGFNFYLQQRVKAEVEAAFAQVRSHGGKASYGKVSFDLPSRTVTIADIATQSAADPPMSLKIASLTASGLSQSDPSRFSADSIDFTDIEIGVTTPAPAIQVTYKIPRLATKAYSGPAVFQQLPASTSMVDLYRFGFEQLAGISATSITAPELTGTMKLNAAGRGGGDGEFAYTGLAMEGLKSGTISSMKVDGFHFKLNEPAGPIKEMTGDLANLIATDIDMGAMAALFDPDKAKDDQTRRVYRHISAGPYTIASPQGTTMRIDGLTIDDIGVRASRMQIPALLAMVPLAGSPPPSPAQAREMMEKVASLYEGIRIGNAEMRGMSVETPQGPLKLAAMRFNMDGGKIGEIAVEGLDAHEPRGPIKLDRFALKALDISNMMRMAAQFAAQKPSPEQALALLPLIEGAEVKGLVTPYKTSGKSLNVDVLSLDWGQFVGPIPSKVRLAAKLSAPLDAKDAGQQVLVAAGIDKATIDADLGAGWTETSRTLKLEPVKLNIGGLFNASARFALANVPRGALSADPAQAIGNAVQIETGALELTLRDTGAVDIAIAQFARSQNVGRDVARSAIIEAIKTNGEQVAASHPDAAAAVQALARFVETPGQTLVIKLTPLGKVPAMQLVQMLKSDPRLALAQFRIEASTGL